MANDAYLKTGMGGKSVAKGRRERSAVLKRESKKLCRQESKKVQVDAYLEMILRGR